MAIKTAEQLAARRAFIDGADKDETIAPISLEQSFSDLKRMTLDDLLDRLLQIENQSMLIKWRIWWAIRQHFKSDKFFGQYVAEIKNDPAHALCVGNMNQQGINRAYQAGQFCEKFKINDLTKIGILPTAIYELARPQNSDIAEKLFKEVRHKGYPVAEIQRRIAQERAVSTIEPDVVVETEKAPETHGKAYYEVNKNVATLTKDRTWTETAISFESEELTLIHDVIDDDEQEEVYQPPIEVQATIQEPVPSITMALTERSDAEVVDEIKRLIGEQVADRLPIKTIGIYKQLTEWMESEVRVLQGKAYPLR